MACVEFQPICYTAGDTVTIDFQYLEDDGETPIPLTGATAQMQLLDAITDAAAVKDMTGGITDEANGSGTFSLTKVESQALLPIGEPAASIKFVSVIKFTFSDTTTKTVAGLNVTIEQGGIR
jgi:hypothetical protein